MVNIKNGVSYEKNGWLYISVKGTPKERGFAHGYFAAKDFKEIQRVMSFLVYENTGKHWDFFIEAAKTHFKPTIMKHFREFYEEMEGIAEGCKAAGVETSIDEIIAWNNSITILDCWYPSSLAASGGPKMGSEGGGQKDRCSAFIANGDYTTDGKIVIAHNSFVEYMDGQFYNAILDITPTKGHRIIMQTAPCCIWSGTDVFITSKGIMGTETTIGGFGAYENNDTIACRIRQAMQYGDTLDDYVNILLKNNSGDYANAWLFADIHTNEIMRFELGLKYHDVQRTKNGYFYGCNFPFSPEIRNFECSNTGYCDVRRHQGARQVRIPDMVEQYKGRINVEVAKIIISDHYDVYLKKVNPCSRTICAHYDLDPREFMSDPGRPKPFQARGVIDGAVMDTESAKKMSFYMRWGNSCGMPFNVKEYCNEHRQWSHLEPYLHDRPSQPWTLFSITDSYTKHGGKTSSLKPHKTGKRSRRHH
jgi:Phospholipase B